MTEQMLDDTKPNQPPLIVVVGSTAVGKTSLSLELCERFNGEIIGADSRQIYRQMDIGTAKPTSAEQERVPHHLIDICDPDEPLTLAEYQRLAYNTIDEIHRRNNIPFLVGGTALYIRAVVEGLRIPEVPPDPALRVELEAYLAEEGRDALFQRLKSADPATAAVIDGKNPRRVLRALEIYLLTGKSKISLEGKTPPPYRILLIGLSRERKSLHERIDRRVELMLEEGLVEETQRLLAADYDLRLPAMTSLGYREIQAFLAGELTLSEATSKLKTETHRYVRHQETWWRKLDNIHWFEMNDTTLDLTSPMIQQFLQQ